MKKRGSFFLQAIAILVGATIGAGVLGIPRVVQQAGFWTGMAVIAALGITTLIINLYMGEVALRTNGNHQITGYAEKYTGKPGKQIATIFMIFGTYGALIAYMMGAGESASAITKGNPFQYSIIFFIAASFIVLRGIRSVGKAELAITTLLIAVVILIPIFSADHIWASNMNGGFDITRIMIPYGVVLFAFMGTPAIPELKQALIKERKLVRNAIITGTMIPLIVYLLFAAVVVGIIGKGFETLPENHTIATVALSWFVRPEIAILANIFAILTMSTSFIALSFALLETYKYDYKLDKKASVLLTFTVPLAIFIFDAFMDVTNFLNILAIVGSITGGIIGVMVVVMHHQAKRHGDRKPEFSIKSSFLINAAIVLAFVAGIINELWLIFFS
ncbi:hypothetical protein HY640_02345 [Candidatus Woesearchaeota archaeon]|nr:hypothetical protein [Candidatus Woesearchaeota archaeon]